MNQQLIKWMIDLASNIEHAANIIVGTLFWGGLGIAYLFWAKARKSIGCILVIGLIIKVIIQML